MARKHVFLHYTRYTHLYLGVFIAPALLFFAFTGALQTFSFHETTRGSSYKPPAWIATLAQIHKKQTMTVPVRKLPPSTPQSAGTRSDKPDKMEKAQPSAILAKPHNPLPLKLFFLVVSIGLFLSTVSGLYMSYRYSRNRKLITGLLIAGVIIPIALLSL
ncbi:MULTISPECIES: PepSY domain-containing protein [Acidobacteriaceae]|uniref:PepSY domain-containing protein n=1 Tax=Acidobacteriaceae TaxID=204434 RepID=UPI00131A7459|nr:MULTISPECIES: PepSY domain-containing protein [Acidobacteriaceae]MDW5264948.1 PepSY domain-containing protein [Edaphobacter sp.]